MSSTQIFGLLTCFMVALVIHHGMGQEAATPVSMMMGGLAGARKVNKHVEHLVEQVGLFITFMPFAYTTATN